MFEFDHHVDLNKTSQTEMHQFQSPEDYYRVKYLDFLDTVIGQITD